MTWTNASATCPHCSSSMIVAALPDWRCRKCKRTFTEPIRGNSTPLTLAVSKVTTYAGSSQVAGKAYYRGLHYGRKDDEA